MTYSLNDVNVGDKIKLEHGDGSKLVREVHKLPLNGDNVTVNIFGTLEPALSYLLTLGWSITAIERAVVLPIEPSTAWRDVDGNLWIVDYEGVFGCLQQSTKQILPFGDAATFAPFTRLVPEADTARKVFERIADFARSTTPDLNIPVRKTIYLSEKPSFHYHPGSGERVVDPPQVRVTVKGVDRLRQRLHVGALKAVSA